MARDGYLVITDISGYSTFLHESELDHARGSLSDLLNLLVEHTRSPLRIVELEGDAVFSHAPAEEVESAATLTDMVEDAYVAFRRAVNLMVINTTCTCRACRLLPTLDLKFFVHYGSYARQEVADHQKLVGHAVNLIHRLLKNRVTQQTGIEAYAAYTEPAVEELKLERSVEGLVSHVEAYEDIGQVELYVVDMHGVWETARGHLRLNVDEASAVAVMDAEFSLPPEEMWPYITDPVTRNVLTQSDWQKVEPRPDGVTGAGATYVCAHGSKKSLQTIVDWDPPRSYTVQSSLPPPNTTCLITYDLKPDGEGSRLRLIWDRPRGPLVYRLAMRFIAIRIATSSFEKGVHALKQRIRQDREGDPYGRGV